MYTLPSIVLSLTVLFQHQMTSVEAVQGKTSNLRRNNENRRRDLASVDESICEPYENDEFAEDLCIQVCVDNECDRPGFPACSALGNEFVMATGDSLPCSPAVTCPCWTAADLTNPGMYFDSKGNAQSIQRTSIFTKDGKEYFTDFEGLGRVGSTCRVKQNGAITLDKSISKEEQDACDALLDDVALYAGLIHDADCPCFSQQDIQTRAPSTKTTLSCTKTNTDIKLLDRTTQLFTSTVDAGGFNMCSDFLNSSVDGLTPVQHATCQMFIDDHCTKLGLL